MSTAPRLALLASDTPRAQEAAEAYRERENFVSEAEADAVIVLGGDGFMLQTLHHMLDSGRVLPAYGIN
ncbi:MAG: NAD(+) kinase, partial [Novosphingobium sp.]